MSNPEDRPNEISGYKATLSNPNVSQEAKQKAQQMLKECRAGDFDYRSEEPDANKNPGNVAGGLNA